ncbi:MAG: CvpA family protein [Deltaproteobacteria bacterium]|nr:CvpA family protein [Deltaproteobacteria bacterium]
MNLLDYIIVIIIVYLLLKGIFRGFIKEIASFAGIIIGVILSYIFLPDLTNFLRIYLPDIQVLPLISFVIIFTAVLFACNLLGWGMHELLKKAFLGWFDKGLGACLALLKGIVIVYLGLVLITFFLPARTPLIAGSALAPWVIRSYQSMSSLISPDFYQRCKMKIVGEIKKLDSIKSGNFSSQSDEARP